MSDERLPAVKRYKAHVKLIQGSQPMFCKARKIPLPLQERVKEKLETMVRQGILEPVQTGGVTNGITSSVAAEEKWSSETMRGPQSSHKMAKLWTRTIRFQTWRPFSIISMGPLTLEKFTYQMHIIKLSWTRIQKKYAQSTHRKDCSRCAGFLTV